MLPKRRHRILRNLLSASAFIIFGAILIAVVRWNESFAERIYVPFSRMVSGWLGAVWSYTVWSVAEMLLILFVTALLLTLLRAIVHSIREKTGWLLLIWCTGTVSAAACLYFLFILLWGGCYHAPKLEYRLSLYTEPQPEEILLETARWHLSQVLAYTDAVPRDAEGAVDAGGFEALASEAVLSMRALSDALPGLFSGGIISTPKRAVAYPVLARLGISGIYVPFTGECIVNTVSTDPFLPSTMCHELAHRLSFAPEQDANLIAYLACMQSEDATFRYSGALMAFTYCYNALSEPEDRAALWAELPQTVVDDFARNSEAWRKYETPPKEGSESSLRKIATAVNNAYLQSMGQSEGVKSYGRVVDMLIALYMQDRGAGGT